MKKFEQTEQYQGGKPAIYIYRGVMIQYSYENGPEGKTHKSEYFCTVLSARVVSSKPPQRLKGRIDMSLDDPTGYRGLFGYAGLFDSGVWNVINRAIERGYRIRVDGTFPRARSQPEIYVTVSKGQTQRSKTLRFASETAYAVILGLPQETPKSNRSIKDPKKMLEYLRLPPLKDK